MNKTLNLAKGGLLTALGVALIYISSIVPTSKIYLIGIASCIIPVAIISTNIKNSILIYFSTSIISFLMLGFKGSVVVYILFFGLYGFVKYFVEKLRNIPMELILKLIFFNISIAVIYLLYKAMFIGEIKNNIPISLAVIMFQFVFLIYDYALTIFIHYIHKRLPKLF